MKHEFDFKSPKSFNIDSVKRIDRKSYIITADAIMYNSVDKKEKEVIFIWKTDELPSSEQDFCISMDQEFQMIVKDDIHFE